jgi:hypothetical protein
VGLLAEQGLFGLQASKGWLAKFGPKLGLAGLAGLGGIWLLKNTEWGQRLAQSVANKLNELSLYGERVSPTNPLSCMLFFPLRSELNYH